MLGGICLFATVGFIGSLFRPLGLLRLIAAFVDDAGTGIGPLITPILWLIFFILYPLGLVDWLVALHWLDSNMGYLLSHESPSLVDVLTLILALYMFAASFGRIRKLFKSDEG